MSDNWSCYCKFFVKTDFDALILFFYISAFSVFCDGTFSEILLILAESDFSFKKKKIFSILLLFLGGLPFWVVCYFWKGLPLWVVNVKQVGAV